MMTILVPIFVLLAVVPLIRHHDRAGQALALRRAGLGWMAVFASFFGAFRTFQNFQGPLDAIALFVVSFALAVLGWHRPLPAAVLLLAAAVLPMVFHIVGSGAPVSATLGGSLAAATTPGAVTGLLYLLSVLFENKSAAHPAPPKAAPTPA